MGRWRFLWLIVLLVGVGFLQRGLAEERYTVKTGDTLSGISKSYGVSVEQLKKANRLEKDFLRPNQILVVPTRKETRQEIPSNGKNTYVVKQGDSLHTVSKLTGVSVEELKELNQLRSSTLMPGQTLLLKPRTDGEEEGEESGGSETVADLSSPEQGREKGVAEPPLGKWNNSEERNLFVKVVKNFLGAPYRLGGSTLRGIDCSALVKRIYEIFDVTLPRTAREQLRFGKAVGKEELQEGDLVFFKTLRANRTHVGIYIGNQEFVHASSHKREVKVDSLDLPYFNKCFLRGVRVKELEQDS